MLTKKELIETLKMYDDNAIITDEQNRPFVHLINTLDGGLIMSTTKPIGVCNRTGSYVYPSLLNDYAGFCPELDEDLYIYEFTKID